MLLKKTILLTIILIVLVGNTANAGAIEVPGNASTIQGGINLAAAGDTVFVHKGSKSDSTVCGITVDFDMADFQLNSDTRVVEVYEVVSQTSGSIPSDEYDWFSEPGYCFVYFFTTDYDGELLDISCEILNGIFNETVSIGKPITLRGEYAPETIIYGNGGQPIVRVSSDNVTVESLTFEYAGGWNDVAGVFADSVSGLHVKNNMIYNMGGWGDVSAVRLEDCDECGIINNFCFDMGGWGDVCGVRLVGCGDTDVFNNTFYELGSWQIGAAIRLDGCAGTSVSSNIASEIMWGSGYGIYCTGGSSPSISYNCFHGCGYGGCSAGTGDISSDPLLNDPYNRDVHLRQDPCQPGVTNPCVDGGDPSLPVIIGTTRTDGIIDSSVVDMGFHYPLTLTFTRFIDGLAPDWNQPSDYPDFFDATGPAGPGPMGIWRAWCAPTCGAMLVGHWEDVLSRAGLADGSADGNQDRIPPGYLGPRWGAGPAWHDYCADGDSLAGGPHLLRGSRNVEDLGFYMDTNGFGIFKVPHTGTYYKDMAPGLNFFFGAVGATGSLPARNLTATTLGVNPCFGGFSVKALADMLRFQVDNGRTAIAHFKHWNLDPVVSAAPGTGGETEESEFDTAEYKFSDKSSKDIHDEEWNYDTDGYGLGHAVLVVGYAMDQLGNVTHVIVHDNWFATERNVMAPVGDELAAVTTVDGFSLDVDQLTAGTNGFFEISYGAGSSPSWLAYSLAGPGSTFIPALGVTLDLASPTQAGAVTTTDASGYASWTIPVPPGSTGVTVWFQALQAGRVTNVVSTVIQ